MSGADYTSVTTAVESTATSAEPSVANSNYLLKDPHLQEIMLSDAGVEALLNRCKQSIFATKEFAVFIKKLATIESEHSAHLKKTARALTESFRRPEIKKGTFQTEVLDIIKATDRMGDAGNSYIDSMHRIHDELNELVKSIDRQRKTVKESATRMEKNLVDAEQLAEKAKSKYDSTCEELDKARNNDPNKKVGFGKRSEDELHKRMTIAEVDYQQKVDAAQRLRRDTETKMRVDSVKKLQSLILECDEALNLQVMRYANLSETLQLNRGFVVSPIKPKNSPTANLTVKEMACKIDSQLDFYNYVLSIPKQKKVLNRPEIVFRKHPTLGPAKSSFSQAPAQKQFQTPSFQPAATFGSSQPTATFGSSTMGGAAAVGGAIGSAVGSAMGGANSVVGAPLGERDRQASSASQASHRTNNTIIGSGTAKTGPILGPVKTGGPAGPRAQPESTFEPTPAQNGGFSAGPQDASSSSTTTPTAAHGPAAPEAFDPQKHGLAVFGTDLEELLDYEEGTVPRIVYQCIQAIDNFGLEVEGIYRNNGNAAQIQEIKRQFNVDASAVDLLRPSEEVNDIHSVASALKLYFRELPDPLLTKEFHREFMNAANIEDDIRRRDTIHAVINKLPDPNYTTLRYLIFHLFRVQERESINRMGITNLGIVWGPTLMATDYSNVGEMAVQGRVIETVLINAYAIFEAE